jgi:hypothetical protein
MLWVNNGLMRCNKMIGETFDLTYSATLVRWSQKRDRLTMVSPRSDWVFWLRRLPTQRRLPSQRGFAVEALERHNGEPQVRSQVRFTRVLRLVRSAPQFMNDFDG